MNKPLSIFRVLAAVVALCVIASSGARAAVAANNLILTQRNTGNTDNTARYVAAEANSLLVFNASLVPTATNSPTISGLLTLSSTSGTSAQISGTAVASFGVTANATIGVSADTTSGVFTFTAPTSGSFVFTKPATIAVGATTSALTDLLINPTTKASGNLIDAQVNSVSKLSVTNAGALTTASTITAGGVVQVTAGSLGTPALNFGTANSGLYGGSNIVAITSGGGARLFINATDFIVASGQVLKWDNNSNAGSGTPDIGLKRVSAGVLAVTDASSGAGAITASNATLSGVYIGSTQALSGAGAANITTETTKLTTAGTGDAITLANGVDGQAKILLLDVLTSGGHTSVLTPTTKTGFTTVTFTAAGQSVTLKYVTTRGWIVTGSYLSTIAP